MERFMASLCGYQERRDDPKNWPLGTTAFGLDSTQIYPREGVLRDGVNMNELLQVVRAAVRERDETKDHLQQQSLLGKNSLFSSADEDKYPDIPLFPLERPLIWATPGNSSTTTEYDSAASDNYNYHSFVSSPVESSLGTDFSHQEIFNVNMTGSANMVEFQQSTVMGFGSGMTNYGQVSEFHDTKVPGLSSGWANNHGQVSAMIDDFAWKKPLPEKGKLRQAVMAAGPLLKNLLLDGSLPRWRNPPLPPRPLQALPLGAKAPNSGIASQEAVVMNSNYLVQSSSSAYQQENIHCKCQICSASSLNFSGTNSLLKERLKVSSSCASSYFGLPAKRQRLQ